MKTDEEVLNEKIMISNLQSDLRQWKSRYLNSQLVNEKNEYELRQLGKKIIEIENNLHCSHRALLDLKAKNKIYENIIARLIKLGVKIPNIKKETNYLFLIENFSRNKSK